MPRIYDPHDRDRWYEDAQWHRKPSGSIVQDGKEVAYTLMCRHCGCHFVYRKFRKIIDGGGLYICRKCGGDVCGRKRCIMECRPIEKQIDLEERGIARLR
jgi:hypothetical protein